MLPIGLCKISSDENASNLTPFNFSVLSSHDNVVDVNLTKHGGKDATVLLFIIPSMFSIPERISSPLDLLFKLENKFRVICKKFANKTCDYIHISKIFRMLRINVGQLHIKERLNLFLI